MSLGPTCNIFNKASNIASLGHPHPQPLTSGPLVQGSYLIACLFGVFFVFGFGVVVTSDFENEHEQSEGTSLPSDSSSWDDSSSSDEELFGELNNDHVLILEVALAANQTHYFFNANQLKEGGHVSINREVGVEDRPLSMQASPLMFKSLTSFTLDEFHDFCSSVCPTTISYVRTMGEVNTLAGCPYKFSLEQ